VVFFPIYLFCVVAMVLKPLNLFASEALRPHGQLGLKRMSMCEKDQNLPWGYDLFRDPFAPPPGYYGPPPGYCDGNCCHLHYGRVSQYCGIPSDFYFPFSFGGYIIINHEKSRHHSSCVYFWLQHIQMRLTCIPLNSHMICSTHQ